MAASKTSVSGGDHVEHVHAKQQYTCEHCSVTFFGKNQLEAHMLVHTGGGLKCEECGLLVTTIDGLRKHRRIHTGEKPYKCDICGRSFTQPVALENHKRVHTKERPFVCGQCGARYTQVGNLRRHMVSHTGEKAFECPDCHRRFTEKASMKRHQVVHTGDRPYSCELCGSTFRYRRTLRSHIKKHGAESIITASEDGTSFLCNLCGKTFSSLKKLNPHIASHGGKAFLCKMCGKMFAQESWYERHLVSHNLHHNPLECDLCKRTFVSRHKLKRHQVVHTGERPYPCTECGSRFGTKANLKIHIRIHTGEKPYVCHICGDAFSAKGNMTRHRSFHFLAATRVEAGGVLEMTKHPTSSESGVPLRLAVNQKEGCCNTDILPVLSSINVAPATMPSESNKLPRTVLTRAKNASIAGRSSLGLKSVIWNSETARHSFWKTVHPTAERLKRKNARHKHKNFGYKYRLRNREPMDESCRLGIAANSTTNLAAPIPSANVSAALNTSEIFNTSSNDFLKLPENSNVSDIKFSMSTAFAENKLLNDAILSLNDKPSLSITHAVTNPGTKTEFLSCSTSSTAKQFSPFKTVKSSPSNATTVENGLLSNNNSGPTKQFSPLTTVKNSPSIAATGLLGYSNSTPVKQFSRLQTVKNSPSSAVTVSNDDLIISVSTPEILNGNHSFPISSGSRNCQGVNFSVNPIFGINKLASDGMLTVEDSNSISKTSLVGSGFLSYCNSSNFQKLTPFRIMENGLVNTSAAVPSATLNVMLNASENLAPNGFLRYRGSDDCAGMTKSVNFAASENQLLSEAILSLKDRISISIIDTASNHGVKKESPFRYSNVNASSHQYGSNVSCCSLDTG